MSTSYLVTSLPDEQLAEFHRLMNEEVRDVAVFFMNPDGVINTWNRGAEEMKGYTAQEAIGQHLRLLYTEPDRLRGWPEHNLAEAKKQGFYREETWRQKKDGSLFWARIALTALFDHEGKHLGFSKITVDLTDHKMLERCVAEREETRRVLRAANAGMWNWQPAGRRMEVCANFMRLLGYPDGDEAMNLDQWLELVDPQDRGSLLQRLERAEQNFPRGKFAAEVRMRQRDGSTRWFHALGDWHQTGDKAPRILGGVMVDIDELKTAGLQLRAAIDKLEKEDARKDEFLAMLAHELRNPLAPIRAAAEVLRLPGHDPSRVKKTSEIIGRQVDHMTRLVDDLLDVSRVTRGLVSLEMEPVVLSQILNDAIEQVQPMIQAHRHRLALELPPERANIRGDAKRLVQMVANLLTNAAKFTPDGGHIRLWTEVQEETVSIHVADDGVGMPPHLVEQAFDLFVQAERTPDRATGGLGLGLALVRSLAQLHGGTASCESPGQGLGSTFNVCLPLASADDALVETPSTHMEQDAVRPLRLLVVDDNVDAAQMLAMYLEQKGHQVAIEYGAFPALERAREERPDVCLLDIGLPEMDGYELARRLRAQQETTHAMLIAVTGYGQERDRQLASLAGFNYLLAKPVDLGELTALLDSAATAGPLEQAP